MDFTQISENSYIFNTNLRALTATVLAQRITENEFVLIDSGCSLCPEFFKELDLRNLRVRACICTHLHWDHTANNEEIVNRHGVVFATEGERAPYAGQVPHNSHLVSIISGNSVTLSGKTFRFFPTPGHTPGHIAVITPDNICHLGDAIMSPEQLSYAKLPYMQYTREAVFSMKKLRDLSCAGYVAAHSGYIAPENFPAALNMNIQKEMDIYNAIKALVKKPAELDDLTVDFIRSLGITRPTVLNHPGWRLSVKQRILELVDAGELIQDGNTILPPY